MALVRQLTSQAYIKVKGQSIERTRATAFPLLSEKQGDPDRSQGSIFGNAE